MINIFKTKKSALLTEALPSFKRKGGASMTPKQLANISGEGFDQLGYVSGYGKQSMTSFNSFYNNFINTSFENEAKKISSYRLMAEMPEIASVLEDIIIESTQEDIDGETLTLDITDPEIIKNDNIVTNITDEFNSLFTSRLKINDLLWDFFRSYYTDGRLYIEKVINKTRPSNGIINLKRLPSETMAFETDPISGNITAFYQFLSQNPKKPQSIEEAEEDDTIVVFHPEQIIFIDYGIYGRSKDEIFGYLEKVKQPFNQLKLLETSLIIYRIVKAPERLVFTIDTGAMPMDKAMKFVEKVKQKLTQKMSYDSGSGSLHNQPEIMSMLDNYFLPQSADGRGSRIDTVGGNPSGFAEIDDIWYFSKKLYIALKYPMSRVTNMQEGRSGDSLFMGSQTGEINRDEIRWAKFLERHQNKFTQVFTKLFLLHLEFMGLKHEYDLDESKLNITMTPPNNYKQQMSQMLLESQMSNYQNVANNPEISKTFAQQKYLKWTDEDIQANADGFKKDKELIPQDDF